MRLVLLIFVFVTLLRPQQTSTSVQVTTDVNGNAVAGPQIIATRSPGAVEVTQRLQSINGNMVPLERVEERVVKEDSSGRVVERTVRRYDQTGHPGPVEKTTVEEQKRPGSTTVRATTYRADLNGNMQLAGRTVTDTRINATGQTSETVVEGPSLSGSLETVEKKSVVRTGSDAHFQESSVTYRKGQNGFYPAAKQVVEHSAKGNQVNENAADYEVGSSGNLELHSQTATRTVKRPDGTEVEEIDRFGKGVPGTVSAPEGPLKLTERDVVERRPGSGNSVVETVSVQRPTVSNPGVLGPSKVISETVCQGKCQ